MELQLKPKVLAWARERARLSPADLALKMKRKEEQVQEWERTGTIKANWAEKLAQVTHTPYGCLFLSEPMEEKLPVSDFRTLKDKKLERPSPDLIDVMDLAVLRQAWYRDHLLAEGAEPLPFVGSLSGQEKVAEAALHIRKELGIGTELRAQARTWADAMKLQTAHLEEHGILVMRSGTVGSNTHRVLDVEEFRGFALSDELAPVIFVNGADYVGAQMFTLMHELVHVFLGQSAISNLENTYAPDKGTEQFCNAVAAEILVPADELRHEWQRAQRLPDPLKPLVGHFKVSGMVMLRRLRDLGLMTPAAFKEQWAILAGRERVQKAKSSGGDYYGAQRNRASTLFSRALIASTLVGETLYRDAYHLLGIKKHDTFVKYARELNFSM